MDSLLSQCQRCLSLSHTDTCYHSLQISCSLSLSLFLSHSQCRVSVTQSQCHVTGVRKESSYKVVKEEEEGEGMRTQGKFDRIRDFSEHPLCLYHTSDCECVCVCMCMCVCVYVLLLTNRVSFTAKRGMEKSPFDLPDFIKDTGIQVCVCMYVSVYVYVCVYVGVRI